MREQIDRQVKRYLNRLSNRSELRLWLSSNRDQILESGDKKARQVADDLHGLIVDVDEGVITEGELRRKLSSGTVEAKKTTAEAKKTKRRSV
ncbi:MAG: hypothetical protein ACRD1R_16720 [Acidobacteriota bacterium]